MIKDITLGQNYNTESVLHMLDPRTKLNSIIVYLFAIFFADSYISYLISGLFLVFCIFISNVPFSFMIKGLKSIIFLIILSVAFNMFLTPGIVIFKFYFFQITKEGLVLSSKMVLRLVFLVVFSSLLTLTTTPMQLTDGIEKNLSFLKRLKVPVNDIELMMSIALRFVPVLVEEIDKIMKA